MLPEYDKYAPFIWASFCITAGGLFLLAVLTILRSLRTKARLEALENEK